MTAACLMAAFYLMICAGAVHADELASPMLDINGVEIYDGSMGMEYGLQTEAIAELPAGISFDPATYTVTLENVNVTVPADSEFIDGTSYGAGQTHDLHIVLKGNNVINCQNYTSDEEYNPELIHNNGNLIIEGNGTLTIKNNMTTLVDLHDSEMRNLTIKNCTINTDFGYKRWELFSVQDLILEGCTLNVNYSTDFPEEFDDHTGTASLTDIRGGLIMKNAVWNIRTSGQNDDFYADLDAGSNAEFHNSTLNITGGKFSYLEFSTGDVIFDNSSFLGGEAFSGINAGDPATQTYYNFLNKHQYVNGEYKGDVYSGKSSAADLRLYFDIVPYKETGTKGTENKETENKNTEIKVSSVKISAPSKKIAAGKKVQLKAAILPANAANKTVKWTSSNTKVAKVSSSGKVTLLKKSGGKKVTITAAAQDGSGKKATIVIKSMKGVVKKIKLSGAKTVKAGKSIKLKAKITASKGANKTLKWTSSNKKYAKVTQKGKVTTLKAGKGKTVKITAKALDGSNKKAVFKIKIK